MKKLKRFSLLMVMMVLSLVCFSKVNAAETHTVDEQLAIDKLASIGVMIGTDNGFEGSSNLTRAQAATIMLRLKGISEDDIEKERKRGVSVFKDVKSNHWALGYINLAYSYGLVKGVSATEFNPEAKVKISELVTMAVRALNADKEVEKSSKEWPDNYMDFAKDENLLIDITSTKDKNATRMETAFIVTRTVEADTWKVSGVVSSKEGNVNQYSKSKGDTILKNIFKVDRYVDETVSTVSSSKNTVTFADYEDDTKSSVPSADIDTKLVDLSKVAKKDNVEVWYNKSSKKIILVSKATKGKSGKTKDSAFSYITKFTESSGKITFNVNGKSETYYISDSADNDEIAIYNGKTKTKKELVEILKKANTDKTLANLTGKLEYAGTNIRNITFGEYAYIGVAKSVSSSKISFYDKDTVVGTTADSKITIDKDTTFVCNEDGEKLSLSGIKEGFIVKYFYNDTDKCYNVMTFNRTEIGDVTSRSSTKIEVDDEEFTVNFIGTYSKPSLDDEIKIYLNSDDEVILYSQDEDIIDYEEDDEDESDDDEDEDDEEVDSSTVSCTAGIITSAVGGTSGGKKTLSLTIADPSDDRGTTRNVDLDATLKLFTSSQFDDKSILQEYVINNCVGEFVQYRVESSKFVLYQFGDYRSSKVVNKVWSNTSSNAQLTTASKRLGSYTYVSRPTVYEAVRQTNGTLNVSCNLREISISDLNNGSKYLVSMYYPSNSTAEYITIRTTKQAPVTVIDTWGIVKGFTEDTANNKITINLITAHGAASHVAYNNTVSKEDLVAGSYITFKLDGDVITSAEVTKPVLSDLEANDKIKFVKLKIENIESKYVITTDKEAIDFDSYFLIKANAIVSNESGEVTFNTLNTITTKPAATLDSYLVMVNGKVVTIIY